jgi:hypothetical protein
MVDKSEVLRANTTDPTSFLESKGLRVLWEGRHGYIMEGDRKVYRITLKPDGRYVSCSNRGNEKIGDNIALVRVVAPELNFQQAVAELLGYCGHTWTQCSPSSPRKSQYKENLIFPPEAASSSGRSYLTETRGIDLNEVMEAERQRAVRYTQGYVAFCGYDEVGALRNVCFRASGAATPGQARTWNLKGSDKGYPIIFQGSSEVVWIVEGGVDGLAARSLYRGKNLEPPTVIVSGGALVLSFLDNQIVQSLIRRASVVWLAREWEKDEEVQKRVDLAHSKQKARVEELLADGDGQVKVWWPQKGIKDIAEHMLRIKK